MNATSFQINSWTRRSGQATRPRFILLPYISESAEITVGCKVPALLYEDPS